MAKYDHLTIDANLHRGIPDLTKEEFAQLEKNIIQDGGLTDPIVVWTDIIVDGRNRWKICKKHNLELKIEYKNFADDDEARDWIINRSLGRRNLTSAQRVLLVGELFVNRKRAAEVAKCQSEGGTTDIVSVTEIATQVAQETGVSERDVYRAAKVAEAAENLSAAARTAISEGEIKPTRAQIETLAELPKAEQNAVVAKAKKEDKKIGDVLPKPRKKKQGQSVRKTQALAVEKGFGAFIRVLEKAKDASPATCKPHHAKCLERLNRIYDDQLVPWMNAAFGYEMRRASA